MDKSFVKNVIVVMSGTAVAQAIPILITPFLTRIYTPEQFGFFSFFVATVVITSVLHTLRLDVSILQQISRKDSRNNFLAVIRINACMMLLGFVIIFIFKENILAIAPEFDRYIYIIPFVGFIIAFYNTIICWDNKYKKYKRIGVYKVLLSSVTALSAIIFGQIFGLVYGLLLSFVLGYLVAAIFSLIIHHKVICTKIRLDRMVAVVKLNKRYIFLDTPSTLLNVCSIQLPSILFVTMMSPVYAAYYYMINRLLNAPLILLSGSVGMVFRQEATEQKLKFENYNQIFNYTAKKLVKLSLPIFVGVFLFAPLLVELVFGDQWTALGEVVRILTPMFFVKFIASPLSYSFYISDKLQYDLYGQFIFMGLVALSVISGAVTGDYLIAFYGISLSGILIYSGYFYVSYKLSKAN